MLPAGFAGALVALALACGRLAADALGALALAAGLVRPPIEAAAGRDLDAEVTRRRRAELARLLRALPPDQHEPVVAAFRAFAAAAGELPQPGAALGLAAP